MSLEEVDQPLEPLLDEYLYPETVGAGTSVALVEFAIDHSELGMEDPATLPPEPQISPDEEADHHTTKLNEAQCEMFMKNLKLIPFLTKRFEGKSVPTDDLRQVAAIGLLKAVSRFDPDFGTEFSTFATPTITGEIKRHYRDNTWAVKPSRRTQEASLLLNEVRDDLRQHLQREPNLDDLAEALGTDKDTVAAILSSFGGYTPASLDTHTYEDDNESRAATISVDEVMFERLDDRAEIKQLLSVLDVRSRKIVWLRFFEDLTQQEIADQIGVSQMHVHRLLNRALEKMQNHASAGAYTD